jgi:AbrB family looped-hinge helix DNA binding protein
MPATVKITRKGQVTIPKEMRDFLGSDIVEFRLTNGNILVKPVKSVAGSLSKYAKKYTSLKDIRDKVWERVAHDRASKKTS